VQDEAAIRGEPSGGNGRTQDVSAARRAYLEIRRAISSGRFNPGDRLREEELGALIGLSRTPVRDALRRLEVEGFILLEPNRGARVADWDRHDLEEIFQLRVPIESLAAQLAAEGITEDGIDRLLQLAQQMEGAALTGGEERTDVISDLNNEFHHLIAEASGNRRLARLRETIVQVPVVHSTFSRYDEVDLQRSFREHRELIAALRAGDGELAAAIMRAHLLAARSVYLGPQA
jgi:DNA-binding GntR family transcriptional regulator